MRASSGAGWHGRVVDVTVGGGGGSPTVLVGEPGSRQGDVDNIAAGIALLPPEGGTICLLAGTHRANITLAGRSQIRFTGCPGLTRWLPTDVTEPLAVLVDTVDIGFHDIIFESGEAPAIVADKSDPLDAGIANGGLTIEDCVFLARHGCALKARSLDGARMAVSSCDRLDQASVECGWSTRRSTACSSNAAGDGAA